MFGGEPVRIGLVRSCWLFIGLWIAGLQERLACGRVPRLGVDQNKTNANGEGFASAASPAAAERGSKGTSSTLSCFLHFMTVLRPAPRMSQINWGVRSFLSGR